MPKEKIVVRKLAQSTGKKFVAEFESGKKVKFGEAGASDFTKHKDAERMSRYIVRHGGRRPRGDTNAQIQKDALTIRTSSKEKWGSSGVRSKGFWSRWMLWSRPSLSGGLREARKAAGTQYSISLS